MNILDQTVDDHRKTQDGRIIQGASHTSVILNHKHRNKIIVETYARIARLIDKQNLYFDAIACCGTSGLMVAPNVAHLLKKNIIVVRKQIDGYSDFMVEGANTHQYIILDDLVCSGSTIRHIIKTIKKDTPRSKCVGVYSYMPDQCAYQKAPECCQRELGVAYLNRCK